MAPGIDTHAERIEQLEGSRERLIGLMVMLDECADFIASELAAIRAEMGLVEDGEHSGLVVQ